MPARSVALALHGRLAGWQPTWAIEKFVRRPGQSRSQGLGSASWDIEPDSTLRGFARFVHSSIWERIVVANRRAGLEIDVFLHSWNPEIGPLLDELYQPKRSRHEKTRPGLQKVSSQHLSLKTALQLLGEDGAHELVLVMRHDVIWYEDFVLANLSTCRRSKSHASPRPGAPPARRLPGLGLLLRTPERHLRERGRAQPAVRHRRRQARRRCGCRTGA